MNKYQKLFAILIALVTFGAGIFHTLATYSPPLKELISSTLWLSNSLIAIIGLSMFSVLCLMAKQSQKIE